jgi:hypothetical protein
MHVVHLAVDVRVEEVIAAAKRAPPKTTRKGL